MSREEDPALIAYCFDIIVRRLQPKLKLIVVEQNVFAKENGSGR